MWCVRVCCVCDRESAPRQCRGEAGWRQDVARELGLRVGEREERGEGRPEAGADFSKNEMGLNSHSVSRPRVLEVVGVVDYAFPLQRKNHNPVTPPAAFLD